MKLNLSLFKQYPVLRFIGVLLGLENLVTAISWISDRPLTWILQSDSFRICWPFIPRCDFTSWPYFFTMIILSLYICCALISIIFWFCRKERNGFLFLGLTLLLRIFIVLQDYRLAENSHYLAVLIFLLFALSKDRLRDLPFAFFILSITFGALRWGADWSLKTEIPDHAYLWNRLGTFYVLLVEIPFATLYFSKRKGLFNTLLLLQFIAVILLWPSLGFHNSLSAFLFLGIIPLVREASVPTWTFVDFRMYFKRPQVRVGVFLFLALQMPQWYLPGPTEMTGQGKPLGLYVSSEKVECEPYITIWRSDFKKDDVPLHVPWIHSHLKCDPYVYIQMAKKMCSWLENRNDILQTDLYIPSRYHGLEAWVPIVRERDICSQSYFYSLFLVNSWIH